MFNLILNAKTNAKIAEAYDQMAHDLGEAIVLLKEAAVKTHALSGELYGSAKGALLVSVPNALVRGAFSAIDENGLMLPNQGKFNAHIVVMTPEEVSKIGGLGKITERGKHFHYNLGPLHEGPMTSSFDFSRVWFLSVSSPELTQLRKTYGLDSGPGKHGFNIVVALRRLGVLGKNEVTKLADTSSTKLLGLLKQSETDLIRAAKAKEVLKAIKQFSKQRNIDPNQALLLAGGSMYFRGLKDNINDIDFMHPGLKDFTKQTIGKYELDGGPGGMPEDAYASDKLYGLNVQRPEAILSFYKFLNRPKDQQKIQMLEALVNANVASPVKSTMSQDDVYSLFKKSLPKNISSKIQHVSGGLPDVKGLSDVDVGYVTADHKNLMHLFPKETKVEHGLDSSLYNVPGYDRAVGFYATSNPSSIDKSKTHREVAYGLAAKYPELLNKAKDLKASGLGTEPAWAKVLNLKGDPYEALLDRSLIGTSVLKKATADIIPGGKADNVPDKAFNSNKLEEAQKHEMEHTNNPALAKEVAKDHMAEDEDYYEKLKKIEKKSEVDPSQLILVSGHSGAGKTTAARKLSEMLNLPLRSIDDYPEFRAFFKSDPTNKHLELVKGSPERKEFKRISRNAARDTIANLEGPAVVEGGQLSYMPSNFLSKYPNRVIVKTPLEQLLAQRLERVKSRQLSKGKPWDEEIAKKRNDAAKAIYKSNRSSMDRFSKIPGTINHGSRDSVEKLIQLLNLQKEATIRTRMGHESDADVVTPAAEDVAFLENKPAMPKEKKKEPSENTAKVRNAVVDATKETFGVDPTYKKAQWAEVLKKLKEFGNS